MTASRPCDCAGYHRRFLERDPHNALKYPPRIPFIVEPIPALHEHEDERCSLTHLGIGGCPGLPHCRDWIVGAYNAGITMAEVMGDKRRAWKLSVQRDELAAEFAKRKTLADPERQPNDR